MEYEARKTRRNENKSTPTPTLDERCEWGNTEHTKVKIWSFLGKVEYGSAMSLEEISGALMD